MNALKLPFAKHIRNFTDIARRHKSLRKGLGRWRIYGFNIQSFIACLKSLLVTFLLINIANQAKAEIFVSEEDCEDPVVEAALFSYQRSKQPIWFIKSLTEIAKLNEAEAQNWFGENKAKFYLEGDPRVDKLRKDYGTILGLHNSSKNQFIKCNVKLIVFGEIDEQDVTYLKDYLQTFANPPFLEVDLISNGGSISAAIEIGKIIRDHYGLVNVGLTSYDNDRLGDRLKLLDKHLKYATWIKENSELAGTEDYRTVLRALKEVSEQNYAGDPLSNAQKVAQIIRHYRSQVGCYSACTLVYVGGVSRHLELNMKTSKSYSFGLHQHFIGDDYLEELDVNEAVELLKYTSNNIKNYLSEMGVSDDLFQLSVSIAKDDLLIVDDKQLSNIVPFVQAEYGAVIPEKVEKAVFSITPFLSEIAEEIPDEIPFDSFIDLVNERRRAGDNPALWAVYNDYHISRGQFSQKF